MTAASPSVLTPRRLLACSLWIGLAYGLTEAIGLSLIRLIPWAAGPLNGTTLGIFWMAPLEYVVVFGAMGVVFALLSRLPVNLRWDVGLVFLLVSFAVAMVLDLQDHRVANYASSVLGAGVAVQVTRRYRRQADRWLLGMARTLPHLAGVVALAAGAGIGVPHALEAITMQGASGSASPDRPNVLLLVVDALRADHVSSYGYRRPTTPRLDRLAAEGALFERAHAASSWTLPSHASIMTGRLPHEHRAGDSFRPFLGGQFPTLAGALRESGYATGGFVSNTFWAGRQVGMNRGFTRFEDVALTMRDALTRPVLGRKVAWELSPALGGSEPWSNRADVMNRHLTDWIDGLGGRPFFAFVNYMDVHGPYLAPPPFSTRFTTASAPAPNTRLAPTNDDQAAEMSRQLHESIDGYDGSLVYLDQAIGQLLDQLEQRGLSSNTLVIVTSDHGESFGEHGFVNHGHSLYLDQTRVPLIVRLPGRIPAGVRHGEPVGLAQLPSTILTIVGGTGQTFAAAPMAVADGQAAAGDAEVITEVSQRRLVPGSWPASAGWLRSVITRRWHFILSETGTTELYDLDVDASEADNRAAESDMESLVAGFTRSLRRLADPVANVRNGSAVGVADTR